MADGSITWDLIARDKASDTFDKVAKKSGATGSAFDSLNKSTSALRTGFGALAAGGGIATALDVISGLANASSDLTEAQNAVNVTFTSGASTIDEFADRASTAIGLSRTEALQASGAFGSLFTNIGATGEQAAVLSRGMLQLGGDLASLRNLGTEDALEKIRSGLIGETEPLRSVGVFLSEAAVKSKALELGLGGAHGELSEGEKVMARYSLIQEQLAEAQGDFANTSDSLANAQRAASASMGDLAATAGGALAPTIAGVAINMGILARATDDLIEKLGGGSGGLGKVVNFLFETLNPLGQVSAFVGELDKQFGDGEDTADIYAETMAAMPDILDSIANSAGPAGGAIEAITKAQVASIDSTFGSADAQERLSDTRQALTEAERDYADALNGTGKYADNLAAANDRLAAANESVARSQRRVRDLTVDVGDAQERLAAAQIRYGVGSKEARDAARDLQSKQEDLADANGDVAKSHGDVARAQDEVAKARDLSDERRVAAEKLSDVQRTLERDVYNAAKAEVELGVQTAAAKGITIDAITQTDLLRGAIERLRDTEIPIDSPVVAGLSGLLGLLAPPGQTANETFRAGERAFAEQPAFGDSGGGNWPAGQSPVAAKGPAIGQVVINYPIDYNQLIEQGEYASGVR